MSELRSYRHSITGLVERYAPGVAEVFPELVLVADGAKPLAYVSLAIPADAEPSPALFAKPASETKD